MTQMMQKMGIDISQIEEDKDVIIEDEVNSILKNNRSTIYDESDYIIEDVPNNNITKPSSFDLENDYDVIIHDNFKKNTNGPSYITGEVNILTALNKNMGYLEQISTQKNLQEIILMPLEPGISLEEFLINIKNKVLSFEFSLISSIKILESYFELFKKNILHRDITPANILIDDQQINFTFIDFEVAVLINDSTNNNISYEEKIARGTPSCVEPKILMAMIENDPEVAVSLITTKLNIVIDLIKKDLELIEEDRKFTLLFINALFSDNTSIKSDKLISFISYIINLNSDVTPLFIQTIIQIVKINANLKFQNKLKKLHPDLKSGLESKLPTTKNLPITERKDNYDFLIVYNEKTEIYSLGRVFEDIFQKTESSSILYNQVFNFINKCKSINHNERPSILEAIKFFNDLLNIHLNIYKSKYIEKENKIGYICCEHLQEFIDNNKEIDFNILKQFSEIILVSNQNTPFHMINKLKLLIEQQNIYVKNTIIIKNENITYTEKLSSFNSYPVTIFNRNDNRKMQFSNNSKTIVENITKTII